MTNEERLAFVERQKEKFPEGTRIHLVHMADDPNPIPDNSDGTVSYIDDSGQIHVNWDCGRHLAISQEYGDTFQIIGGDIYLVTCRFSFDGERCGYITINRTYAERLERAIEYCNEKKIPISVWVNDTDKANISTEGILSIKKISEVEAETLEKYLKFHEYVGDVILEILQMYEDATK